MAPNRVNDERSDRPTESATSLERRVLDQPDAGAGHVHELLEAAGRSAHYRVLSRIGAGGMGVVYKAIDTRLQRSVALKTMLRDRGADIVQAARLRKEALTAASLDHPYICKVYELIDAPAEQLIVMEFVEGETLSRLLSRERPPLPRLLDLAIEIADGLAAAHSRGLVHRDLKPGNVMVTPSGHVKLLDFGLARDSATDNETEHITQATDAHAGTPFYMAPEQAEGRPITARADVFALGVVLFECLTGRLPFEGNGRFEYVRHLCDDPATPVQELAPDIPPDLGRLVDACLEKAPRDRPESAAPVVETLRAIRGSLSASSWPHSPMPSPRVNTRWLAGGVIVAAVIAVALAWRVWFTPIDEAPIWRLRPLATTSNDESRSRISPDAQWIAYLSTAGGSTELLVGRTGGGDPKRVVLPAGIVVDHLWSPDGNQIAYVVRQDQKWSVGVVPAFFGGVPEKTIAIEPPTDVRLLRWIERALFFEVANPGGLSLQKLDLDAGSVQNLSVRWAVTGRLRSFDVRPDGRRVVFAVSNDGQEDLWLADLDGTAATRLTSDASFERFPLWSGSDRIVFQSNRGGQIDLWETTLDTGRSAPLTSSPTLEEPESTSRDGRIVSFRLTAEDAHLWKWDQSGGEVHQVTDDALSDFAPAATRDGSTVVFQRRHPTPLLADPTDTTLLAGSLSPTGLTSTPRPLADGFLPRLSSDGAWLAYLQRGPDPGATLFVTELSTNATTTVSTAAPRPAYSLFPLEWADQTFVWSPGGADLYFVDGTDLGSVRRLRAGERTAGTPVATAARGTSIRDVYLSPDGRRLTYRQVAGQTTTLHVVDLEAGTAREVASLPSPVYVRGWHADGQSVLVVRASRFHEDFTADVEILAVPSSGDPRPVGTLSRALPATARFDPVRGLVYVVRSEAGLHQLVAFSLTAGAVTAVLDAGAPGITFSGVLPLADGSVLGVRNERRSDIWVTDAGPR